MVVLDYPVDQQGVGCTARYAVEVTSYEHGDVCAGCNLLQALKKCVHLYSIGVLSGAALWLGIMLDSVSSHSYSASVSS